MNQPLDPPQPPSDTPPPPPSSGSGFGGPPPGGGGGTPPEGNPWEQRDRLGFVNALIENVKLFALNPTGAFARTRRTGDYVGPLIFAVLVGWVGAFFRLIWSFLIQGSMMSMLPANLRGQMGGSMLMQGGGGIVAFILFPIIAVIGLFIGAGILHLCSMLVGVLSSSESGFEGTFRAVAFSSIANLAFVIPVLGGIVYAIWFIFLATVGLSTMHRSTQGKALIAVLIPVAVCCVCAIIAMLGAGAMIAGMMSGHGN